MAARSSAATELAERELVITRVFDAQRVRDDHQLMREIGAGRWSEDAGMLGLALR